MYNELDKYVGKVINFDFVVTRELKREYVAVYEGVCIRKNN